MSPLHSHACRDHDREQPGPAVPLGPRRRLGDRDDRTRHALAILVVLELLDPHQEVLPGPVQAFLREPELFAEFVDVDPRITMQIPKGACIST